MRVLLIHRYYWPDKAPCAGILRWVARHLVTQGHSVDVLSSQPSYHGSSELDRRAKKEVLDGVRVTRLSLPPEANRIILRIFNALYLGVWIVLKAITGRYDVIIVATVPPVLGGFFSAIAARLTKARLIYYCMDLHPDIGRVSGDFANPLLYRLLQTIDDWSCRQANPVLVHSKDMRNTLLARTRGSEYRIEVLNNFALPSEDDVQIPPSVRIDTSRNRLTLVYAGNIGRFQGLETLLNAMILVSQRRDIALIVMGEGVAKAALMEQQKRTNANVIFLDYQPVEVAKQLIQQADIGLVMLVPEMYKYAYPSKTMIYLEQGKPIIAAVETESELAKTMHAESYGFSVPIGDAGALSNLLVQLADDPSWKSPMNASALLAFKKYFSPEIVLAKWDAVVRTGRLA